jgi:hypothetical protein
VRIGFIRRATFTAILILLVEQSFALVLSGIIQNTKGEPLAYASIYIEELKTGTTSNINGNFRLNIPSGAYNLTFKYVGYESKRLRIELRGNKRLEVTLQERAVQLRSVTVRAGDEDPAYPIMRKTIAKAKYHLHQVDSYTGFVYTKGSGRIKDAPKFIEKQLKKEGMDSTTAFTSEALIELEYKRPNIYREHFIAYQQTGQDMGFDPTGYVFLNYYQQDLQGIISPLSPKAFNYYRYKYLGSFSDSIYTVNKIMVIPNAKGSNVLWGTLYIIEDYWSLHTIDLNTEASGVHVNLKVTFEHIEKDAWLPVNHVFKFWGKVFGVEFEGEYVATISDIDIKLNQELLSWVKEVPLEEEIPSRSKSSRSKKVEQLEISGNELNSKKLQEVLKEYDKKEKESEEGLDFLYDYTVKMDSVSEGWDSAFWEKNRSVPLTQYEEIGYRKLDSVAESKADSNEQNNFGWIGDDGKIRWKITDSLEVTFPISASFNSVDGAVLGVAPEMNLTMRNGNLLRVRPDVRWAFSRNTLLYKMNAGLFFGPKHRRGLIAATAGSFTEQFNGDHPISEFENSLTTLFLESNHMKLYQKDYFRLHFRKWISKSLFFDVEGTHAWRSQLENTTDFTFIKYHDREFISNVPANGELGNTGFENHTALLGKAKLTWVSGQKFIRKNGEILRLRRRGIALGMQFTAGQVSFEAEETAFYALELSANQKILLGGRGDFSYNIKAGTFLGDAPKVFIDYAHTMGNRAPFARRRPNERFRLLPYYEYSTGEYYINGMFNMEFNRLLITQVQFIRLSGLKENVFVNHLLTRESGYYTEVGYSLENILRLFKLEGAFSFDEDGIVSSGVLFGVSIDLDLSTDSRDF